MAYTYDQLKICECGVDRMRLDLGDTEVDGGRDTCALSDEEYSALIAETYGAGRSWKYAQYRCLQVIVARLAMMTDIQIDGMTLDMSRRYERWKIMLTSKDRLFYGISAQECGAHGNDFAINKHMFDNPRAALGAGHA